MPATILRPLLLLALVLWCAAAPAQQARTGAQPRPIILVLDASGSMWKRYLDRGPRRGEFAVVIADTLTKSLRSQASGNEPAATAQLGLVRFGYQFFQRDQKVTPEQKCKDVEHIRPARIDDGQIDAVARASGVGQAMDDQGWNPKGKTPVTAAILQAAQDAPAQGADLIIVTDIIEGEQICDPDPCPGGSLNPVFQDRNGDFVRKKIRVRFVITSGLEEQDLQRAGDLARCFDAELRTPQSLAEARKIGTQIGQTLLPVLPTLDVDLRFAQTPGRSVTLPGGFRMADLGLTLETLRNGDRGPSFKLDADRVTIRAPDGDHDGHLFSDIVAPRKGPRREVTRKTLKVAMNADAPLAIELEPATLVARAQDASGRPITAQIDWTLTLVPAATSGTAGIGRTLSFAWTDPKVERTLPPGHYVVTAKLAGQTQRRDVDLWFGETDSQTVFVFKTEPRNGTLVLQIRDPAGLSDPQITAAVMFGLTPLDPAGPEIPAASGTRQRVPEGRYRVTPRLIGTDGAKPKDLPAVEAEVVADEATEVVASLPVAVMHVELEDGNKTPIRAEDTRFEVAREQAGGIEEAETTYLGPRLVQVLSPGRYRIKASTGRGEKTEVLTLSAGDREIKKMTIQ